MEPKAPMATTDSCSRGQENSDASDCESDCQFESPASEWAMENDFLERSEFLTREEVVERRLRRSRKLTKQHLAMYWHLAEELRRKYRRFYIRNGKSGWRDDDTEEKEQQEKDGGDSVREPENGNAETLHCGAQGCNKKPMALSVFCFEHILLEPRQRLYKPCGHVMRTNGQVKTCGKPVLRAVVPSLCLPHFNEAQRQANRSLNKVLPDGIKFSPKIHLIFAQYVRVIQSKRRSRRAALKAAAAVKVEANGKDASPLSSSQAAAPRPSAPRVPSKASPPAHHDKNRPVTNGQAKKTVDAPT